MSTLKVEVVRVESVLPHPNANRLEIAQIKGWQCIVGKGSFQPGQLGVYFPIDSLLPEALEAVIFKDTKIKLDKHRVKTIKLRGAISQGLLVQGKDIDVKIRVTDEGKDLTNKLGVTKYEPPAERTHQYQLMASRKQVNPHFHKYSDIENWKNYPHLFEPGEPIWVLEKIHGSNFRAGWVPRHGSQIKHLWKSFWAWLNKQPTHRGYEFVYGSHNVQLQDKPSNHQTWHGGNIYYEMVEKYDLRNQLDPGEVVYGEVYGDEVQPGYMYDCQPGERKMRVFDMQVNGAWVPHDEVVWRCHSRGILLVPIDASNTYQEDAIRSQVNAPSQLGAEIREGIVIKPKLEHNCWMGRKILKWKSDEFLLTQEDDTH